MSSSSSSLLTFLLHKEQPEQQLVLRPYHRLVALSSWIRPTLCLATIHLFILSTIITTSTTNAAPSSASSAASAAAFSIATSKFASSASTSSSPPTFMTKDTSTSPSSVSYPASAQGQGNWYIQGGFFIIGSIGMYSLDLTIPWHTNDAPWVQLPDSPATLATSCILSFNNTYAFSGIKTSQPPLPSPPPPSSTLPAQSSPSPIIAIFGNEMPAQPFIALLDLAHKSWITNATNVNVPQRNSGLVAVGNPNNGKIYIRGGYQSDRCDTMDIYDPKTDTIESIAIPSTAAGDNGMGGELSSGGTGVPASQWYSAVWSQKRGSILYFGGKSGVASDYAAPAIYEYIPATNAWLVLKTTGKGPTGREDSCMAIDATNDRLVVYGGQNEEVLGDIYVLDLNSLVWSMGPSSTDGRVGMACTIHDDGLLVWGGSRDTFLLNPYDPVPSIYNITTMQWSSTYKMSAPPSESVDPHSSTQSSTLGLVLGLTLGGIALVAGTTGMYLYKRERKKTNRRPMSPEKDSGLSLPYLKDRGPGGDRSGEIDGPNLQRAEQVHHRPGRHQRNGSRQDDSDSEESADAVHSPVQYAQWQMEQWGESRTRRSHRPRRVEQDIGHKFEMDLPPQKQDPGRQLQTIDDISEYKVEDPSFKAPSNRMPVPAPPIPMPPNPTWIPIPIPPAHMAALPQAAYTPMKR
ncbi:hypothetical protein BG004_007690 [Podila humilis]|nr:hypothetical protein BG004_007690 [Podila humilis]